MRGKDKQRATSGSNEEKIIEKVSEYSSNLLSFFEKFL